MVPEPEQIYDVHFVPAVEQLRDQNVPHISRTTRDKNFHASLLQSDCESLSVLKIFGCRRSQPLSQRLRFLVFLGEFCIRHGPLNANLRIVPENARFSLVA